MIKLAISSDLTSWLGLIILCGWPERAGTIIKVDVSFQMELKKSSALGAVFESLSSFNVLRMPLMNFRLASDRQERGAFRAKLLLMMLETRPSDFFSEKYSLNISKLEFSAARIPRCCAEGRS